MEGLLFYLVRSLLVSGLLTGYYVVALRDKRMHGFNRFYLLSSVVLALVLPVLRIGWNPWAAPEGGVIQRVFVRAEPAAQGSPGLAYDLFTIGIILSALASVASLVSVAVRVLAIYRLKRRSLIRRMDGYALIETDAPGTPFSFLRNLFWRSGEDTEDVVNRKMVAHELAHIRGRHSWDILWMQIVVCVFWMNPFFWFIRRELAMVLEYIADAASGAEGDPEGFAEMLLQAFAGGGGRDAAGGRGLAGGGGRCPDLSNGFFHSPIKRRLLMITTNNRPGRKWMRMAIALPVLVTAALFFSCSKDQKAQDDSRIDVMAKDLKHIDLVKLKMDSVERYAISSGKILVKGLPLKVKLQLNKGSNLELKKLQDSVVKVYFIANPVKLDK